MWRNKFSIILLLATIQLNAQNQDIFDFSNSLLYADYLYKNAEYNLAIQEYKRVLFLNPLYNKSRLRILDCFILEGEYEEGIAYSKKMSEHVNFTDTLLLLQGKLLLLNRDFTGFDHSVSRDKLSSKEDLFLSFSEQILLYQWEKAASFVPALNGEEDFQAFIPIINRATGIKYKSPQLSFAMSAFVPGAGKVYSGYWKDGLFSFLFTGIAAWQSYRGFKQNGSTSFYGWLMGGVSLSFYTGNLYGSVKAANKRNHEYNHQIVDDFEKVFIPTYSNF